MQPESFAYGALATRPPCHIAANRMKSGTMSTRPSLLFPRPKLLIPLHQNAIDFMSEKLLWFGDRSVAGMRSDRIAVTVAITAKKDRAGDN
jgi:hypothetical protein